MAYSDLEAIPVPSNELLKSACPQIFRHSGISVRSDFFHKGFNLKCALLSTTNCAVLSVGLWSFFQEAMFLFFVIIFSYIAHCLNLVAAQLLNICLIAEAQLHS